MSQAAMFCVCKKLKIEAFSPSFYDIFFYSTAFYLIHTIQLTGSKTLSVSNDFKCSISFFNSSAISSISICLSIKFNILDSLAPSTACSTPVILQNGKKCGQWLYNKKHAHGTHSESIRLTQHLLSNDLCNNILADHFERFGQRFDCAPNTFEKSFCTKIVLFSWGKVNFFVNFLD